MMDSGLPYNPKKVGPITPSNYFGHAVPKPEVVSDEFPLPWTKPEVVYICWTQFAGSPRQYSPYIRKHFPGRFLGMPTI